MVKTKYNKNLDYLYKAILRLENISEAQAFFRDLCTIKELEAMGERWAIVNLLNADLTYREIADKLEVSATTVSRVASWLNGDIGGYRLVLAKTNHHNSSANFKKG
ncbi:MAG: YerC/YecD family TrpR-related protein [Patescibacteria group bacterium]